MTPERPRGLPGNCLVPEQPVGDPWPCQNLQCSHKPTAPSTPRNTQSASTREGKRTNLSKKHRKPSNKPNVLSKRTRGMHPAAHARQTQPSRSEGAGVPAPGWHGWTPRASLPAPAPDPPRAARGAPRGARHRPIHFFGQSNVLIKNKCKDFSRWHVQGFELSRREEKQSRNAAGTRSGKAAGPGQHTCNSQALVETPEVCYKT